MTKSERVKAKGQRSEVSAYSGDRSEEYKGRVLIYWYRLARCGLLGGSKRRCRLAIGLRSAALEDGGKGKDEGKGQKSDVGCRKSEKDEGRRTIAVVGRGTKEGAEVRNRRMALSAALGLRLEAIPMDEDDRSPVAARDGGKMQGS